MASTNNKINWSYGKEEKPSTKAWERVGLNPIEEFNLQFLKIIQNKMKDIVWLAVDGDGTELEFVKEPRRAFSLLAGGFWDRCDSKYVYLKHNTIKSLLGFELSFSNDPVKYDKDCDLIVGSEELLKEHNRKIADKMSQDINDIREAYFKSIKSQNMKQEFAVKSDSFALYEAFKKECEAIGWKHIRFNGENPCSNAMFGLLNGLAFKSVPFLGISCLDLRIFNLGTQYSKALAYAKKVFDEELKEIEESKKKVTYEDVEQVIANRNSSYCSVVRFSDHRQYKKLLAINKLMNVAFYLNPKGENAEWSIIKIQGAGIDIARNCDTTGQPIFVSYKSAQQAIEILGEDVIRLALS